MTISATVRNVIISFFVTAAVIVSLHGILS